MCSPAQEQTLQEYKTEKYHQLFKAVDVNGDGKVTRDELKAVLTGLNNGKTVSDDKLSAAMASMDGDDSGEVDEEEFVTWAVEAAPKCVVHAPL